MLFSQWSGGMLVRRTPAWRSPRLAAVAVLATAAVAIGGCGSSDSESSDGASDGGKPEVTDITIGINADGATGAPLLVGIEKGYFREEGLNVKTQIVAGGAATVPLLISESLQAGYVSSIAWFQAHLTTSTSSS